MVFNRKPEPKLSGVAAPETRGEPQRAQAPSASRASASPEAESVIGNDLSIEGQSITIRCKGSLRVNGNIQADLHSRQLVVGEEALINGSIAAEDVSVFGRVNGAIYGAHVKLHASAQVEGDIHSQNLSIDRGASFDGRSRKVTDAREITPQLEPGGPQVGFGGSGAGETTSSRSGASVFTPPPSRLHA